MSPDIAATHDSPDSKLGHTSVIMGTVFATN
jgi:hypothetical protein